jgi:hypothetical protein
VCGVVYLQTSFPPGTRYVRLSKVVSDTTAVKRVERHFIAQFSAWNR